MLRLGHRGGLERDRARRELRLHDVDAHVFLDDSDTQPIVKRRIPSLIARGNPPKKWQFKSKADGLQKILLKADPAHPGSFKVVVKAKRWVPFANGADQSAANTDLTSPMTGAAIARLLSISVGEMSTWTNRVP